MQQKLKEKKGSIQEMVGDKGGGGYGASEKRKGKQGERWQLQREMHGSSGVVTWAWLVVGQRCSRLQSR